MSIALDNGAASASSEASFLGLIRRQLAKPTDLPKDLRLDGQVAVVTGANGGLGFEASRHLLRLGLSHLIMGVRSKARGDEAATRLRNEFPSSEVSVWILDMESYDSCRGFAEQCAGLPQIDMVVLNAGFMKTPFETVSGTGHEVTMQVNYFSTTLLSILLLSVLRAMNKKIDDGKTRNPPVLTIVGSDIMWSTKVEAGGPILKQFDEPNKFAQPRWYGVSKTLLALFVWKLSETVSPDEVVVNLVNPGMTGGTNFFTRESFFVRKAVGLIQFLLARKPDVAATTYVDAVAARGRESHGAVLSEWTVKPLVLPSAP
jgi:NAD(P)-dependent dehydrogenase (short-subunit alcohol dehydrogenase family)